MMLSEELIANNSGENSQRPFLLDFTVMFITTAFFAFNIFKNVTLYFKPKQIFNFLC